MKCVSEAIILLVWSFSRQKNRGVAAVPAWKTRTPPYAARKKVRLNAPRCEGYHQTSSPPRLAKDVLSYLTPEDLENELRISRSTVYRLLRSGELPHLKLKRKIRIRREVFEDWCKTQEDKA